jgi:hypothetical protein
MNWVPNENLADLRTADNIKQRVDPLQCWQYAERRTLERNDIFERQEEETKKDLAGAMNQQTAQLFENLITR